LAIVSTLAFAGSAAADGNFFIRGGGFGHGIGMSQYGSYGYAEHGANYVWIPGHYFQGTKLGKTNPNRTVRVLLATHTAGSRARPAPATRSLTRASPTRSARWPTARSP